MSRSRETVIFSAIFAEAFMNDFTELVSEGRIGFEDRKLEKLSSLAELLPQFEKEKLQIRLKIQLAYYILNLKKLNTGDRVFQEFSLLIDCRNQLVHPKPYRESVRADKRCTPREKESKLLDRLESFGVIEPQDRLYSADWVVPTSNPKLLKWAVGASVAMVTTLIDSVDAEDVRNTLNVCTFGMNHLNIRSEFCNR